MNEEELKQRFPNASADFLAANSSDGKSVSGAATAEPAKVPTRRSRKTPKLEPDSRDGTLGQIQVQKGIGRLIRVRVTSFRRRLLDMDNLCEKYAVDLLRYSGVIPSDEPGTTKIEVAQVKVGKGEREFVRIEVF